MQGMPRSKFPQGSLLAAMLGEQAPADVRRAARRLRAEGTPALAVDDDIADLACGLASSEVSRSPGVLDALPSLFWLEARRNGGPAACGISGWVVEKNQRGLAVRGFSIAPGQDAVPELDEVATLRFGVDLQEEDPAIRYVRGLITAVSLPGTFAQMGESAPVVLMPADACDSDASALRGFRLSVAISPDSVPS